MMINERLTLDDIAAFTWNFGNQFFIEIWKGNFVWSDPRYLGGDNTIRPFDGTIEDWLGDVPFGRCKGNHMIRKYCGNQVKIINE